MSLRREWPEGLYQKAIDDNIRNNQNPRWTATCWRNHSESAGTWQHEEWEESDNAKIQWVAEWDMLLMLRKFSALSLLSRLELQLQSSLIGAVDVWCRWVMQKKLRMTTSTSRSPLEKLHKNDWSSHLKIRLSRILGQVRYQLWYYPARAKREAKRNTGRSIWRIINNQWSHSQSQVTTYTSWVVGIGRFRLRHSMLPVAGLLHDNNNDTVSTTAYPRTLTR